MAMNSRKGMVYIFVAIIFLSVYLTIFMMSSSYSFSDKQEVVSSRIRTMDSFISDLHSDFDRATFISAFRSLIAMEEYVSNSGDFFDNESVLEDIFAQSVYYGTINGSAVSIMENSTLENYLSRVQLQAELIDISVNFTVNKIFLSHSSPWDVNVELDTHFFISDNKDSSWWEYNRSFITSVPIRYLKDPLYSVNTLGRVPNIIKNYSTSLVVGPGDNVSSLLFFLNQSYYRNSTSAPSFLMRFTNNLSASEFGIESFVNLPLLSDQGVTTLSDRSVVDYLYFSSNSGGADDHCSIEYFEFTPDWFRLDDVHYQEFAMGVLNSSACP